MKITKTATNELVNEMNNLVFQKIQEELIKNTERKKIFQVSVKSEKSDTSDKEILNSAGIEIVPDLPAETGKFELTEIPAHASTEEPLENREEMLEKIERPVSTRIIEPTRGRPEATSSILAQKLSGPSQIPMVETQHTLENITKAGAEAKTPIVQDTPASIRKIEPTQSEKVYPKGADPYRLSPDE
jgi:hypothetical protein